ncbi:hypothetical protein Tco_0757492, partial [Tanacetum coccineum]
MFCYLAGIEPYYLKCIKDDPFQQKTAEGDDKPEAQWTQHERRVVVQDQRLKSIIMSCLPNDIMKAKPSESLSQTYTRYKTLLNELINDGVNLSKHEINVGFVNSLPEKWLTFSQGLRNANHTQTLDLADIYESTAISTAFFSNNVVHDIHENSNDEVDERSSEEYLRDLDIEFHERALLENSKRFQPKFTPKLIQSSQSSSSQADPKIQKDYKAEY